LRDEKILLSWNGLMIAALADVAAVTGNATYRMAAIRAVEFIEEKLVTAEGRLVRSWHSGRRGAPGFLEDYAFYVRGLIALHQTTGCERFLALGIHYSAEMLRLFSDPAETGLFDTAHDVTTALLRMKGNTDGVVPSGNAVAAMNLLRLGRITGDDALSRHGETLVTRWTGLLTRTPVNHLYLLTALDFMEYGGTEITLSGNPDSGIMKDMLRAIHRQFLPGLCLKFINNEENKVVTASVCAEGACQPTVENAEELEKLLAMQTTRKNPQKIN